MLQKYWLNKVKANYKNKCGQGQGFLGQDHEKVIGTKMSLLNNLISVTESGPKGPERTRIIIGQVNQVTCLVDFLRYFCKFYLLWEFLNFCTQKQIEGFAKD